MKLDQDSVGVGPFITSKITGQLVLEGYLFASSVRVAFRSEQGLWLNFTLSGNHGVYSIEVVPSGFSGGQYGVYAVATSLSVGKVELLFTHVLVFSDYSIVVIVVVGVCVVVVAAKILPRFLSKKQGVQG